MAKQEIQIVKVKDLHLWSENPRDHLDVESTDYDIIKRAIDESPTKWNLGKMVKEMGKHYDFSEIPTVVFINDKPVVFDGNRRIAVLKYLQNRELYSSLTGKLFLEDGPKELRELSKIPCNICDKDTALTNIERKHVNSGSWGPLERDYFLYKHRGQKPSIFVRFEEQSGGMISQNKKMNQGFVKKELLTDGKLKQIGFHLDPIQGLVSNYKKDDVEDILQKVVSVVESGKIATRGENRGKLKETLLVEFPEIAAKIVPYDDSKEAEVVKIDNATGGVSTRKTPRSKESRLAFFGGDLSLNNGSTNNLYRDISDLYKYYEKNKEQLSETFPSLIRMSLRLLVESATSNGDKIDVYINKNFDTAKNNLSQDQKTTLSTQSVDKDKLIKLLQTGAHDYTASSNLEQTIAMSIVVGQMLKNTHGKNNSK
ncbi:MAG TPA: hypothetical protein VGA53_02955 [Candidatus Paceibacterota bacterium]